MALPEDEKVDDRLDAILADFLGKIDAGETVDREAFLNEYPELAPQLRELLDAADWIESLAGPTLKEIEASSKSNLASDSDDKPHRDSATDFSFDGSADPDAATVQFMANHEVVSLSHPGRAVRSFESTEDPSAEPGISSEFARVGPENTQHILPCRFGDYILEKILGRGGMGVVYLASQVQLERRVAIKMIRAGCLAGENEIERFYTEARSAARLDHPNIVSVYQCGEIEGHHYFSMDYIEGTDLAKKIQRSPLAPRDAARYVRDVARAIAYAHEQGVLHRDLKPANVLIDDEDAIIITDFGLAKLMDSEEGLTRSGAALGTPGYMSPEQAGGNSDEQGEATDVYALGAVLFAALTGKPPFQAGTLMQTIMDVMHKPAPQVRQLRKETPVDLDTIVAKCLQKKPTERYASATELADELDRFLNHAPIHARPFAWPKRAARWIMHVPIIAALVGFSSAAPNSAHRWIQRFLIGGLLAITLLFLFGNRIPQWWNDATIPTYVSIAAGSTDGAYFQIAHDIAINFEIMTGRRPSVDSTAGSQENAQRLLQRKADIALMQGTALRDDRITIVAPLYYEAVHLIVRKSANANSLIDLRHKNVAVGRSDSGTRQAVEMLKRELGNTFDEVNEIEVDWMDFSDKPELDAAFAVVQVGHPTMRAILQQADLKLMPLPDTQRISLAEPMFRPYEISKNDYETVETALITLATPAFLATMHDASNRLVRTCLQAVYESKEPIPGLIPMHTASHWQGLPLHPAARRYFESIANVDSIERRGN